VIVVDTNVLVYAADGDSPFHDACRKWLEQKRAGPDAWYATWPILYEFLRVTTHPRVMRRPWSLAGSWDFIAALFESSGFDVLIPTDRHSQVLSEMIVEFPHLAGNIIHDMHTVVLLREHGVGRVCTRDTDFNQFGFLRVVDPVTAN
jgi:hypothetical protein